MSIGNVLHDLRYGITPRRRREIEKEHEEMLERGRKEAEAYEQTIDELKKKLVNLDITHSILEAVYIHALSGEIIDASRYNRSAYKIEPIGTITLYFDYDRVYFEKNLGNYENPFDHFFWYTNIYNDRYDQFCCLKFAEKGYSNPDNSHRRALRDIAYEHLCKVLPSNYTLTLGPGRIWDETERDKYSGKERIRYARYAILFSINCTTEKDEPKLKEW